MNRRRAVIALVAVIGALTLQVSAAHAKAPLPFRDCNSADLPAAAPDPPANTLIINGQMTAKGQEANHVRSTTAGGMANPNTAVTFRTVVDPIPTYPNTGQHYYYRSPNWLSSNWQVQYWNNHGYKFFYTAASSDFTTPQDPAKRYPLMGAKCAGDAALRLSNSRGLYIHEILTMLSAPSWDYNVAVANLRSADGVQPGTRWEIIDYWVSLARTLNKKVVWSEPAQGWRELAKDPTARSYFAEWGDTLVPMFATNFDTPTAGRWMGIARKGAYEVAQEWGMPIGVSIQSWYFRENPDLVAQRNAGLPTSQATGTGFQPSPGTCCNLDPINMNDYVVNGIHYGNPLNGTLKNQQPSMDPSAGATRALAKFGAVAGATYYQVEGTNGSYDVAAQGAGLYTPVNDMAWATGGEPSSYLAGIRAFSAETLSQGVPAVTDFPTRPLYQLWNPTAAKHYYTTRTTADGAPRDPGGNAVPDCTATSNLTIYCYQEIAGYVATIQAAGTVPLRAFRRVSGPLVWLLGTGGIPNNHQPAPEVSDRGDGVLGYVLPGPSPGATPLYSMYQNGSTAGTPDNFYTSDARCEKPEGPCGGRAGALASWYGYRDQGVLAWLYTSVPSTIGQASITYGGPNRQVDTLDEASVLGQALATRADRVSLWANLWTSDKSYMLSDVDDRFTDWAPYFDTKPPSAPTDLQIASPDGVATVTWQAGQDPDIATDLPGTGVDPENFSYRWRKNGGAFSAWTSGEGGSFAPTSVVAGDSLVVEVRSADTAGNTSAVTSGTLVVPSPTAEAALFPAVLACVAGGCQAIFAATAALGAAALSYFAIQDAANRTWDFDVKKFGLGTSRATPPATKPGEWYYQSATQTFGDWTAEAYAERRSGIRAFRREQERAGKKVKKGWHVHHVVPLKGPSGQSRQIMYQCNVGLNSAENLMPMPAWRHYRTYPGHYHANLLKVLKKFDQVPCSTANRNALITTLAKIKVFLATTRRTSLGGPWPV